MVFVNFHMMKADTIVIYKDRAIKLINAKHSDHNQLAHQYPTSSSCRQDDVVFPVLTNTTEAQSISINASYNGLNKLYNKVHSHISCEDSESFVHTAGDFRPQCKESMDNIFEER